MPETMPRRLPVLALAAALAFAAAVSAQSLGEAARQARREREAKRSEQGKSGKVWTNDDFAAAFPELRLIEGSRHNALLSDYEGTPADAIEAMLRLAGTGTGDVVFDLGSGDGRIPIMAAERFGARGVGVELDARLAQISREAVAARNLEDRVKILETSFMNVDLSPATVVTAFLTTEALAVLRPHLEEHLRPGTRVVVRRFLLEGWTPRETVSDGKYELRLYVVP